MMGLRTRRNAQGFSLVELAVVVIIIGVLAAFGVPKFRDSVERSKASEAFNFLASVRSAQERYQARQGKYASVLAQLDVSMTPPKYFTQMNGSLIDNASAITQTVGGGNPTWTLKIQRDANTSSYDNYTVTFTDNGFYDNDQQSSISCTEITKRINPLYTGN